MLLRQCSRLATFLGILAFLGSAAAGAGQPDPAPPSPETVSKLVAQLGAADFRTRQQASDRLEKLGPPVLPALRKAASANNVLEVKRRIETVVARIENVLLKAEEKHWQALDAPRRGIKDRLLKILGRAPLSDHQLASAIHLLAVGRPPTDDELKRAQKQLGATHSRPLAVLQLTRSLVQGKEYAVKAASANVRLLKVQQEVSAEVDLAARLARLNSGEFQKLTADAGEALKAVQPSEQAVDLAFLLVLSRFPTTREAQDVAAHLKRTRDRSALLSDVVWALMNTREFVMAQ
jgi:hypothetical protein